MTRLEQERLVDRTAVAGIAVLALDFLIAAAIGTMSLVALGANLPALVILTVIAVIWSVVVVLFLGSVDPSERTGSSTRLPTSASRRATSPPASCWPTWPTPTIATNVANAYGYKQLTYEPLLGGGLITAFSIPLIIAWGSLAFGLVCLVITVALAVWGIWRKRSAAR